MCQYIGEDPSEINFEELGLQEDPLFARTHLSTTSASSVEDIAGTSSERKIEEPKEYIPGTTIENLPGTSTQTMFADRDSLNPAPQSSGEEISKTVEGGDSLIIIFKRKRSMTSSISDSSIDSDSGSDVNVTKKFKHSPEDEEKSE
ncbi:hypothetical protein JTB14_002540 [Gonioctena quinquepunctata]|nr:hypothetical protein JTB14_002540 [Gonioctena quinquepunctata]